MAAVIDSGLARVAKYDPWSGRPSLEVAKIARASAVQRAGRAGRLGPGIAVRLFTRGDFDTRAEHDAPEILRADLSETVLDLRTSGVQDVSAFQWLDAPPRAALDGAEQLLWKLGAVEKDGALTDTGKRMSKLPLPPRLSRLVVEAQALGAAHEGCEAAAILAEGRDVYVRSWDDARSGSAHLEDSSDVMARLRDVREATAGGVNRDRARRLGLDGGVLASIVKAKQQLLRALGPDAADSSAHSADEEDVALRRSILAAFPDRVARRRQADDARLGASRDLLLATGGSATLAETSVVRTALWLVAVQASDRGGVDPRRGARPGEKRQTRVWIASAIEPDWLIDLYPGAVRETVDVSWNAEAAKVEAVERLMYERLVIDERPAGRAADEPALQLLFERALAAGMGAVFGEGFEQLAARIEFLAREASDLAAKAELLPLDQARLRALLSTRLAGKRSLAELREGALLEELRSEIGFSAIARLDELAPSHLTLRGGRRVSVHYEAGKPPWIESRLQDFFGSSETPRGCWAVVYRSSCICLPRTGEIFR